MRKRIPVTFINIMAVMSVFFISLILSKGVYYNTPDTTVWDVMPTFSGWLAIALYSTVTVSIFKHTSISQIIKGWFKLDYRTIKHVIYAYALMTWVIVVIALLYNVYNKGAIPTYGLIDNLLLFSLVAYMVIGSLLDVLILLYGDAEKKPKLLDVIWYHIPHTEDGNGKKIYIHWGSSSLDITLTKNAYTRWACFTAVGNDEHNIYFEIAIAGYKLQLATGSCLGLGYPIFNDGRELGFTVTKEYINLSLFNSQMGHHSFFNGWNYGWSIEELREGKSTTHTQPHLVSRKFIVETKKTSRTPRGVVYLEAKCDKHTTKRSRSDETEIVYSWDVKTFHDEEGVVVPGKGENSWDQDDNYGIDITLGGHRDIDSYENAITKALKSYKIEAESIQPCVD